MNENDQVHLKVISVVPKNKATTTTKQRKRFKLFMKRLHCPSANWTIPGICVEFFRRTLHLEASAATQKNLLLYSRYNPVHSAVKFRDNFFVATILSRSRLPHVSPFLSAHCTRHAIKPHTDFIWTCWFGCLSGFEEADISRFRFISRRSIWMSLLTASFPPSKPVNCMRQNVQCATFRIAAVCKRPTSTSHHSPMQVK